MALLDPRTWLEHLSEAECWTLLAKGRVGRIAILSDSAPEIYPVNYVVDQGTVVFRTDPGNKLRGLVRSPSVCFEVDDIDVIGRTGWSVLVKGRAVEITDAEEMRWASKLPLALWTLGDKSHWVRIVPAEVTGRRISKATSWPPG